MVVTVCILVPGGVKLKVLGVLGCGEINPVLGATRDVTAEAYVLIAGPASRPEAQRSAA